MPAHTIEEPVPISESPYNFLLDHPTIRIRNWDQVQEKLRHLKEGGKDKLLIISDFDWTLSRSVDDSGQACWSTHGLFTRSAHVVDPELPKKLEALKNKYYPIEYCPKLTIEEKIPHMEEWWQTAHDHIIETKFEKSVIKGFVENSKIELRSGAEEMMYQLEKHGVPLVVFSAGIGNIIEMFFHHKFGRKLDNMHLISNMMQFNEEDIVVSFSEPLIHTFCKNSSVVRKDDDFYKEVSHRANVILLGDSMGDIHMAVGAPTSGSTLKIGFLNGDVPKLLDHYLDVYDIVLVQNQQMTIPAQIVDSILRVVDEEAAEFGSNKKYRKIPKFTKEQYKLLSKILEDVKAGKVHPTLTDEEEIAGCVSRLEQQALQEELDEYLEKGDDLDDFKQEYGFSIAEFERIDREEEEEDDEESSTLTSVLEHVPFDPTYSHIVEGYESETTWGGSADLDPWNYFKIGYNPNELSATEMWLMGKEGLTWTIMESTETFHREKFLVPMTEDEIFTDKAVGLDAPDLDTWKKQEQPDYYDVMFVSEWSDRLISMQVVPDFQAKRNVVWPQEYGPLKHKTSRHFNWEPEASDPYSPKNMGVSNDVMAKFAKQPDDKRIEQLPPTTHASKSQIKPVGAEAKASKSKMGGAGGGSRKSTKGRGSRRSSKGGGSRKSQVGSKKQPKTGGSAKRSGGQSSKKSGREHSQKQKTPGRTQKTAESPRKSA